MKLLEHAIARHGRDRTYRVEFENDGVLVVSVYDGDTLKWKYWEGSDKIYCDWYQRS